MGAPRDLFDAWADIVYGSACLGCAMPGRAWCASCSRMLARGITVRPVETVLPDCPVVAGGEYEGWLRELIIVHKERSAWSLAGPLGAVLATAIGAVGQHDRDDTVPLVLVPVPSRRAAVRQRGHDPALRMTRDAARNLRSQGIPAQVAPILRLRLAIKDSVGLSAADRTRNLDGAFAVRSAAYGVLRRYAVMPRIVVCDDVTTTGATLRAAHHTLTSTGLRVAGAAVVAAVRPASAGSQVSLG